MLPTFILRKRVQALRPNARLITHDHVWCTRRMQTYFVIDQSHEEHPDGWSEMTTTLGRGWTARLAWKNALDALRA